MGSYHKTDKKTKDKKRVIYTKDKSNKLYVRQNGKYIPLEKYEKVTKGGVGEEMIATFNETLQDLPRNISVQLETKFTDIDNKFSQILQKISNIDDKLSPKNQHQLSSHGVNMSTINSDEKHKINFVINPPSGPHNGRPQQYSQQRSTGR